MPKPAGAESSRRHLHPDHADALDAHTVAGKTCRAADLAHACAAAAEQATLTAHRLTDRPLAYQTFIPARRRLPAGWAGPATPAALAGRSATTPPSPAVGAGQRWCKKFRTRNP